MIPRLISNYLEMQQDSVQDYLYIIMPEEAIEVTAIETWVQENQARAVLSYFAGGKHILQINYLGLKILTPAAIQLAIDNGAVLKSGSVPIGVEVNTSTLDVTVPDSYDSPYADILGEDGEVVSRKTVRELMVCIEGTEGKSLILCAEKTAPNGNGSGLVHEEFLRFKEQFPSYEIFTDKQLGEWKLNNIISE